MSTATPYPCRCRPRPWRGGGTGHGRGCRQESCPQRRRRGRQRDPRPRCAHGDSPSSVLVGCACVRGSEPGARAQGRGARIREVGPFCGAPRLMRRRRRAARSHHDVRPTAAHRRRTPGRAEAPPGTDHAPRLWAGCLVAHARTATRNRLRGGRAQRYSAETRCSELCDPVYGGARVEISGHRQ
jgi:hypothetical protein